MKCRSCGAEVPTGGVACEFCGSSAPSPVASVGHTTGAATNETLFARIKDSTDFARRNTPERQAALPKFPSFALVVPIVFFTIFIGIAVFMTGASIVMAGVAGSPIPALMSLCPMAFIGIGIFGMVTVVKKAKDFQGAVVVARPAIIVGRRTNVSGGSGDSSASTNYFLTAEFEDGTREEFQPMQADLFARIAERDAGVLFSRSKIALDFDRVT